MNQQKPTASVDPGDIQAFAKYLDELTPRLAAMKSGLETELADTPGFGAIPNGAAARVTHRTLTRSGLDNITAFLARHEEVATGTADLARRYGDLADLNEAAADTINTALAGDEKA